MTSVVDQNTIYIYIWKRIRKFAPTLLRNTAVTHGYMINYVKKLLKKYSFTNLLFGNNLFVKSYIKIIAREESYKLEG